MAHGEKLMNEINKKTYKEAFYTYLRYVSVWFTVKPCAMAMAPLSKISFPRRLKKKKKN